MADTQRVITITGATGGLGPAVVEAFRASGDIVVTVARKQADFPADLTSEDDAAEAIRGILEKHGRIDVLVHVLGGFATGGNLEDTSETVWRRMLDLNLFAAIHVLKSVTPPMRLAGRGRIIAVGSRAGAQLTPGLGAYSVSNAALHALIQTAALELKGTGVTANVVMPGTIRTEATQSWGTAEQAAKWVEPASIAGLIHWLASDASADVNGALIPVYGES
jgi:NAD(P)-dependent dehydrogenase (short-subunit alcohol dehydrogenase family)